MSKYTLTYSTLLTKLQNWQETEETTFVTELATVVNLACIKVARDLKLEKFRKRSTGTFTASTATISVPTDTILVDAMLVNDGTDNQPMEERSGDVIELYGGEGLPLYWTEQDTGSIRVGPTPDSNYAYTVYGMQRPETISVSNETNWLTDNVPDLLFFACLEWSELFLKDDQRADTWRTRYEDDLNAARDEFGVARRNTETVAPTPDASTGKRNEQQ